MAIEIDQERYAELRAEHGVHPARAIVESEARAAAVQNLRMAIYDLSPGSGSGFAEDLRDVLYRITDILED